MYSLIVVGGPTAVQDNIITIPAERLFEGNDEDTKHDFLLKSNIHIGYDPNLEKLSSVPAILAFEKTGKEQPARLIIIEKIREDGRFLKVRFRYDERVKELTDISSGRLAFDLAIESWETNRNHWMIKDIEVTQVLSEHNLINQPDTMEFPASQNAVTNVFLVHGHDEGMMHAVARCLTQVGLSPIILAEQPDGGKTIIEKFETHANLSKFAVVLISGDDIAGKQGEPQQLRARQNVILELGYFIGKLGRRNVCAIKRGEVELPSDIIGIIWKNYDSAGAWRIGLISELRNAGISVDANRILSQA